MNKAELVSEVAKALGSTQEARAAVDRIFSSITEALKGKDEVRVAGFGTFKVARSKARIGVNPRTGDRMTIEEKTVPKFLPAKDLKDIVNEG